MKGLLLKDWYMMKKYCKPYFLAIAILLVVSVLSDNLFFAFYPSLFCGLIPLNLITLDEQSGWMKYSGAMPYRNKQIVTSKFLCGLLPMLAVMVLTFIAKVASMKLGNAENLIGGASIGSYLAALLLMYLVTMVGSALSMAMVFRVGAERGKIVLVAMVVIFFVAYYMASDWITIGASRMPMDPHMFYAVLWVVGIAIYALAWWLSVSFLSKREF